MSKKKITTVVELDALPDLSVVLDNEHDVWQKRGGEWVSYETRPQESGRLVRYNPFTVIHTPKESK